MIRISRGLDGKIVDRNSSSALSSSGNGSSLMDISNSALRSELESKMFVRAKRLNSGTNDPSFASRVRADSAPDPDHNNHHQMLLPGGSSLSTSVGTAAAHRQHQQQQHSNYNSTASMVSYLSNSDLLNNQYSNMTNASLLEQQRTVTHRSSQISLVQQRQESNAYHSSGGLHQHASSFLTTAPPPPSRNEAIPVLSHDAAKHRIAIKPKNRRPKSFQPTTSHGIPAFDIPPHDILHQQPTFTSSRITTTTTTTTKPASPFMDTSSSPTAGTSSSSKASVLSEVQATYEILTRIPDGAPLQLAAPSQPSALGKTMMQEQQQQTQARKASTMTYSKSFHLPRRPSSEFFTNKPIAATATSPLLNARHSRLLSGVGGVEPPPVPPKRFNPSLTTTTNSSLTTMTTMPTSDEFKNVFSKVRKHVEPQATTTKAAALGSSMPAASALAPDWQQESSSSATSTTPYSVTMMSSSSTLPLKSALSSGNRDYHHHNTGSDFDSARFNPFSREERKSRADSLSESLSSVVSSSAASSTTLRDISPSAASLPSIRPVEPTFQQHVLEPAPPSLMSRSMFVTSTTSNRSETPAINQEDVAASVKPSFAQLDMVLSELEKPFPEVKAKPLISPKPAPRTRLSIVSTSSSSSANQTESKGEQELRKVLAKRIANLDTAEPTPSIPTQPSEPIIEPSFVTSTSVSSRRMSFKEKERDAPVPVARKRDFGSRRSVFMEEPRSDEGPPPRNFSLDKENLQPMSDTLPLRQVEPVKPLRKSSMMRTDFFKDIDDELRRLDAAPSTQPFRSIFLDPPVNFLHEPAALASSVPLMSSSSSNTEKLPVRVDFLEDVSRSLDRPVSTYRPDEETSAPPTTVSSRAAMFQQKVLDFKPLSPRSSAGDRSGDKVPTMTPVVPRIALRTRQTSSFEEIVKPTAVEQPWSQPVTLRPVLKSATLNGQTVSAAPPPTAWTSSVPQVPLKPVTSLLKPSSSLARVSPTSAQVSCGSLTSTVPAWIALAQEKRKRIGLLTGKGGDSDNTGDQSVLSAT
ncbi:hypothetical protein BV898_05549 [Hypsibius exemplaris]|uniref:Uncharacterized protein n=1 Tax=Hypsibius exemplaris TaxID=2072580 RepID=A0A1W0WZ67_HYPEX|nr:hypothetical protein BV898_05549 [Hypsibius exemplaris]